MEPSSLTKMAVQATLHCLTGCAIGEILGTVIGSGFNWSNWATEALTIPLAFLFGYAFTMRPLLKHMGFKKSVPIALASDTLSISSMEIVDNAIILLIPGALAAGPATALFWASLAVALAVAFVVTVPVNRWLIARGKGHAVMHEHHH
ncbi:MAG TPA: DUF4396 domain-containing protein [Candidatus Saccharimonadales bacterium]|nr:DUF4396 domain-containing protein [Candidatus Saccharimonadales bacterium]